jgi:hypothetical protein
VAISNYSFSNFWILLHPNPQTKETGLNLMLSENFQNGWGMLGVGAVIKAEGDRSIAGLTRP